ncbi:SMP-30/gluconolactonase/LRE family protein [Kosakonia cowanii]|uniref:SMP-30/gluconolactonase/LRE family protein n=1 Tax=Kosakonia cowanii TaxID=208223 RepID=UPI0023F6A711|nr:SMP-30/gluconolactonase/LRE family protein [Kosakonia cowanii]MDF7758185.1 SMP-30/gluconolactonase/LRE family protein [Kosakonia cowanii]
MATSRRELLKLSGIATASLLLSQKSFAAWTPAQRYPDPRVVALDDAFREYMVSSAKVEQIATGCRWAEGPVWFGDMRMLLWSDIPNNAVMRWDEQTGEIGVFRKPANNANGHARDRQGRLISCEHDTRRVTRTEYDGTITVLADSFTGKPLNSPNDIAVKSDGSIWFTDPPFGIAGFYEGHKAAPQLPQNVYRLDPQTCKLEVVLEDVRGPNGICFSPDEKILYVVESRAAPNRLILAWDIIDGQLQNKRVHIDCGNGTADGIACDVDGNLWCGWGMGSDELDGVRVFNPQGNAIGMIHLPERCANLCFGGEQRNRLFMAASTSIYALYVNTQGAQLL